MAINVKVSPPGSTQVRFTTNASPIVIKNNALSASATELKQLTDVNGVSSASTGDTLVYNATNRTFTVESPNYLNITDIDGGTF
jgi:hypothetical protein